VALSKLPLQVLAAAGVKVAVSDFTLASSRAPAWPAGRERSVVFSVMSLSSWIQPVQARGKTTLISILQGLFPASDARRMLEGTILQQTPTWAALHRHCPQVRRL